MNTADQNNLPMLRHPLRALDAMSSRIISVFFDRMPAADRCQITNIRRMTIVLAVVFVAALLGCASSGERMDRKITAVGGTFDTIHGTHFRHKIWTKPGSGDSLFVYLEGDGTPWINGLAPAANPTPKTTLAFELMMKTPQRAIYVGRPCYFDTQDVACSPVDWTHGRFSDRIIESLTSVISQHIDDIDVSQRVIVGHSGGGALAVLVASKLSEIDVVVTVAAPLDTDAWTEWHSYEPLDRSENPADLPKPSAHRIVHLLGQQDNVVPISTYPTDSQITQDAERHVFSDFGHVCCWVRDWPEILSRLDLKVPGADRPFD